jgi:hypothetical protein
MKGASELTRTDAQLVINLETAKAFGRSPRLLLLRADQAIE